MPRDAKHTVGLQRTEQSVPNHSVPQAHVPSPYVPSLHVPWPAHTALKPAEDGATGHAMEHVEPAWPEAQAQVYPFVCPYVGWQVSRQEPPPYGEEHIEHADPAK